MVNTDGTSDELVYTPPITEQVDCLTIDGVNGKLFMAATYGSSGNKLYKCDLNGAGISTLISNKRINSLANFNDPALPVELVSFTADIYTLTSGRFSQSKKMILLK